MWRIFFISCEPKAFASFFGCRPPIVCFPARDMLRPFLLLLYAGLSLVTLQVHALGLLAVDYGSDSFKASYVGPGLPFDVLYNKDSKRKTPSLVTLHGDDLLVGADAAALVSFVSLNFHFTVLGTHPELVPQQASRYPKETFSSVKMLLGRDAQDPMVQQHQALFDNKLSASPSNDQHRLALYKPDGTSYAPEEVLAMQLRFARDMAVLAANGDKSFDTVITVGLLPSNPSLACSMTYSVFCCCTGSKLLQPSPETGPRQRSRVG